jgi:hypothetical protein
MAVQGAKTGDKHKKYQKPMELVSCICFQTVHLGSAAQVQGQRPALCQHGATPHVQDRKKDERQRRDSSAGKFQGLF